jgi:hypothetical protein
VIRHCLGGAAGEQYVCASLPQDDWLLPTRRGKRPMRPKCLDNSFILCRLGYIL